MAARRLAFVLALALPSVATAADWLAERVQLQVGSNGPTFADGPMPTRFFDDLVAGLKLHLANQSRLEPSA